jgi:hypothetical protein
MDGAVAAAERKRSRCELTPFLLSASFLLENRGPWQGGIPNSTSSF